MKHGVVWRGDRISKRDIPGEANKAIEMMDEYIYVPMPEEIDFLNFLKLGWIDPKDRVARWPR